MTSRWLAAAAAAAFAILSLAGCPPRQPYGYTPPPADDPVEAFEANWSKFKLLLGQYRVVFRYSDGKKVSLRADLIVENGERTRVDLSSDRGNEAMVILGADVINLVNIRERFYVREDNSPENAGRLVGLYLPPLEVAAVLSGRALDSGRFDQLFRESTEDGGISILAFHKSADLRITARLDRYGRLLTARYTDAATDQPLLGVSYEAFSLESSTGLVWPTRMEIDLFKTGDRITFRAGDVDINPDIPDLDFRLTPRQLSKGKRLKLEDVPPGPPLLYRSAKEYVQ